MPIKINFPCGFNRSKDLFTKTESPIHSKTASKEESFNSDISECLKPRFEIILFLKSDLETIVISLKPNVLHHFETNNPIVPFPIIRILAFVSL